jgi:hypothetical protein
MSSDHRIDIHDEIASVCNKFNLDYGCVRRLDFHPGHVVAEVYRLNENGAKYIEEDGNPALDVYEFLVTT